MECGELLLRAAEDCRLAYELGAQTVCRLFASRQLPSVGGIPGGALGAGGGVPQLGLAGCFCAEKDGCVVQSDAAFVSLLLANSQAGLFSLCNRLDDEGTVRAKVCGDCCGARSMRAVVQLGGFSVGDRRANEFQGLEAAPLLELSATSLLSAAAGALSWW